jgi:ABC-type sugar transport system ATPase subunit
MATIRLEEVTKFFSGDVAALDHINLTVADGQTVAIVGPSGSGKSTLLRVVAGLEPVDSGRIYYDNQEMSEIPPKDRYIGMVFQNYALYPHFAGQGNLSFFFRLRKVSDQETEQRIRETAQIMGVGFDELLPRKPGTLSGGQQQRIAIGRAIVRNPRLFLLDEPLSNLDAKLRAQTRVEIKRLLRRFAITTLYVTHDQTEAIALGDQIAIMRAGKVEQMGPFAQLLEQPANVFVAGFLGAPLMNLLSGVQVGDGVAHIGETTIPLPQRLLGRVQRGQAVTIGIRPEVMQIVTDEDPAMGPVRLRGVVEIVEPDHGRRLQWLHIRTENHVYVAPAPLDIRLHVGHRIQVAAPLDQIYFFDSARGVSL